MELIVGRQDAAEAPGSENVPPPAAATGDSRKRPRSDEGDDEPDGRIGAHAKAAAAHYRPDGIFSPAQLVFKRQRLDTDRAAALNLVKSERTADEQQQQQLQQQQQQEQQQQQSQSTLPTSVWRSEQAPVNLVKRECSIALRCHVQHRSDSGACDGEFVQKFAVIPSSVTVAGLLQFVLQCLDIQASSIDCSASIHLPGWKSLSLSDICEDPERTAAVSLLSQVSNIAVFKVQLPAPESAVLPSSLIRNLLKSLISPHAVNAAMHVAWFRQTGCPLPDATIEEFVNAPDDYEFSISDRRVFSDWHSRMCLQYLEQMSKGQGLYPMPLPLLPLFSDNRQQQQQQQQQQQASSDDDSRSDEQRQPARGLLVQQQQQQQQRQPKGSRARATFDPEAEQPLLQQWYAANPHPGREQLEQYRAALNQLPCRRGRRQLDVGSLAYWFKNARASERAAAAAAAAAAGGVGCLPLKVEQQQQQQQQQQPEEQTVCADDDRAGKENSEVLGMATPWPLQAAAAALFRSPSAGQFRLSAGDVAEAKAEAEAAAASSSPTPTDVSGSGQKRRRTRVFIDPVTEIPQLENWFAAESHPTAAQFQLYASILNAMPFRQKQPCLEAKNIQLWFKNHRAKVKRERLDFSAEQSNREASNNGEAATPLPQSPGSCEAAGVAEPLAPASQEAMSQLPTSQEAMLQVPTSQEAMSQLPMSQEAMMQVPMSQEAMSQLPTSQEAMLQVPTSQEAMLQVPTSQEAMSQLPMSQEAMLQVPTSLQEV